MAARVSRNDPCPCGSGLKYKRCCEQRDAAKPARSSTLPLAVLVLLVAAGAAAIVIGLRDGPDRAAGRAGRVWSPEHGHWHDAPRPGQASRLPLESGSKAPLSPGPAPAGTPPPGKVWSVEHGHWHDAVQTGTQAGAAQPQFPPPPAPAAAAIPPGPAPPGKVWSPEHGHWHDAAPPAPRPVGTPDGRDPYLPRPTP